MDYMYDDGYLPPILTVDSVIFQIVDEAFMVLLIKRTNQPFKGAWALPGGYNGAGETTTEATKRIMQAKAGIDIDKLPLVEQLYTFDTVARDPRGHAVSVSYLGLGRNIVPEESRTTQQPGFFNIRDLPDLAYDHESIIRYAHERVMSKLSYTNAVFALLPELFTLGQLQSAYETVFGRSLDKRNFRKKFLSLNLLHPTEEYVREGAHRPARLHRFNKQSLEALERSFD
jgi:8-oxo-dGTP diphosphatase